MIPSLAIITRRRDRSGRLGCRHGTVGAARGGGREPRPCPSLGEWRVFPPFRGVEEPTRRLALPPAVPVDGFEGWGRGRANPRLRAFMGSEGMLPGRHTSRLVQKLDHIVTVQSGQGVGDLLRLGQVSFDVAETAAIAVPQCRGKAYDAFRFLVCAHAKTRKFPPRSMCRAAAARRPARECALAPKSHSITLSARATNVAGTVTPIPLAVLRLITSSNLVACSTGMSATLVPRRTWTICWAIISENS